ncbi:MAG: rRNA pseudouridine synthase [Paludibacteraceae bacterium]|nr:rRNA pseudouridine synthase [Paludibacteraceae bacterium]
MFDRNKSSQRREGFRQGESPREYNDVRMSADGASVRPRFTPGVHADNGQRRPRQRFQRPVEGGERVNRPMGFRPDRQERTDRPAGFRQDRPTGFRQDRQDRQNRPDRSTFNRPRPQRNDGVYSKKKRYEYQQKYEDPTKPIRLNKFLANAGICSRREADDFIQAGVITVNGEVVSSLGAKVLPTDKIMFHDQPVRRERKVYILLNKPKNTVTTTDDPEERHTVLDIVRNACAERIYPVGRLDRNTTGVLLLTNDGDLAAKLTHPKFGKKKIYAVTLDRELEEADEQIIRDGITLDDERIVPDALEFPKEDRKHIGLEIHSGQNRVVRRIFEKVGYKVMQLDRVSFAGLTKKNVPRGKYRFLTPKEVSMLQMGAFE